MQFCLRNRLQRLRSTATALREETGKRLADISVRALWSFHERNLHISLQSMLVDALQSVDRQLVAAHTAQLQRYENAHKQLHSLKLIMYRVSFVKIKEKCIYVQASHQMLIARTSAAPVEQCEIVSKSGRHFEALVKCL